MQLMKIRAPTVLLKSNTNAATPVANRGILLLLVFFAHEVSRSSRSSRNSDTIHALNTVNSVVFLLGLDFLGFRVRALLAALLRTFAAGFLRSRFAFLARRRFVYATSRSTGKV
jgi:hypothetical protein